ncbi:protein PALS1 isoform X1 [Tribolium castaneum]|uniref:protein PALS1 isoform X1 n=1 Tax=Tribolium castaneum TaxID=7070 RepID=UPI00077DA0A6|nr:PREDICTED: MAGUK p55 subfamily member 5-A isoform X1 [Tribolium castaneum]|eukprot:XP_015834729.1 PREDICTED: MAGUK p55 subfamily member 5-A isoform X1 [Tribolium castaneum]
MVDLGGYVIILAETKDKKIKLYGSPADNDNLEVGDEILEVNGKTLEDACHAEVISHIHQCIRSRTICLRVKRRSGARLAVDLDLCAGNVQDAFVIAVEQQAQERLERLTALKRVKPVDMTKLSQQLNQQTTSSEELNGFINNTPIYVTSLTATENINNNPTASSNSQSGGGGGGNVLSNTISVVATKEVAPKSSLPNGHDIVANDVRVEVKDAPSPGLEVPHLGDRRASSPFQNGRTELLIGAEDNKFKTTAIVESNNNKLGVDAESRPRRRSGSSIVVLDGDLDPVKKPPDELDDNLDYNMVMMLSGDTGPHREMAVDVPDTFIARNKTPPRYPPPKPILQVGHFEERAVDVNQERAIDVPDNFIEREKAPPKFPAKGVLLQSGVNGTAAKPVPPPRDHLKLEKDGRIVNRAPAPQLPATPAPATPAQAEPTREQLDSIKKYQEQIRKRKEEEDRIAAQNDFLKRSLRGSRKLQALESRPQGSVNDGFAVDEAQDSSRSTTPTLEKEVVHTVYGYGDLVASVQRLQLQLKKAGAGGGLGGLEGRVAAVQSLLLSPQFGRALAVHNKVQTVRSRTTPRPAPIAQTALRDCLDALGNSQSAYAVELASLLTGYELEALMVAHDGVASTLPPDSTSPGAPPVEPPPALPERFHEENIKIIKIEKSTEPLGATVRNEGDAVVIGRVVRGGAADKSGLLHEGDEILEVNGIEMRGKSVNAVCDILQGMEGTLTFLIVPASQARSHSGRDSVLHVRAHFDYDPEEDMYIPCRELGISFQKGDVLHVISQDDPNWWQAYREGEEDQTLAGLVPSQSFQHYRESMRLAAEERMARPQRKSSTLLCGKTAKRKKKKGAYAEGGYPIYANAVDEHDPEEILTYEEVSLYYPRANNKRPIVLIGPPNIGRHELRQRLMEDSERFAAAIPHTSRARKENEVDGQDYHFITRAQFEADILSRKFVEHGEYEKAYYGTSLDAIRSVVNSGKICVLNLHPQSLKILRTSDLKPYVVFVAPPSLEKLRQKKIRNGEAYKEEELKDIIEKAREMEDKYGHFFDMIIINNDTERAYHQLLSEINSLEREPQWVPAAWVKAL